MSLNWNISKVKNVDEVCYIIAKTDVPHSHKKGDKLLNPITNGLIWAMMSVGFSSITEKNWKEVYTRLALLDKVRGAMLNQEVDGKMVDRPFTVEDVFTHIGLSTNCSTFSKTKFLGNLYRTAEDETKYQIREMEKNNG